LREPDTSDGDKAIIDQTWSFPLHTLDLRTLPVDLDELRERQRNYNPGWFWRPTVEAGRDCLADRTRCWCRDDSRRLDHRGGSRLVSSRFHRGLPSYERAAAARWKIMWG
jgi:hypothetical protein